jgi:hypothetical protein
VVVDHIEEHGEGVGMTRVDEALERVRAAVGMVRREQIDAVVPPPAGSRELIDGHHLDVRDPEAYEMRQPLDGAVEGA